MKGNSVLEMNDNQWKCDLEEIVLFFIDEMNDNKWKCDFAFMVDLTDHLSALEKKLQYTA